MARPASIALLLAVTAVAVAGCGSNDDSADSRSDVSTTSGLIAPQGTTSPKGGAAGATGATGTTRAQRRRTRKAKQRSSDKGGSAGSTAPGAGNQAAPQPSLSRAELQEVGRQQAKQARILCKASTLQGLALQYGIKNPDADKVAKAYAAPFLAGVRDAVAAGCKKGLLEAQ
jgi:hypothetical protein